MTMKSSLLSVAIAAVICISLTAFATVSLGLYSTAIDNAAIMLSAIR